MQCDHNCSTCNKKRTCAEKHYFKTINSNIKKIIGIMSGKGGVGKSTVTSLLASSMAKRGYKIGILDADITGPSIPTAFGVHNRLTGNNQIMYPGESKLGIKIVSVNLVLENEKAPVIWRGPILGNAVKQFYSEVEWGELDYLFIDMPPGTSDVQLTVLNNLPVDGVVMVTSPQDLVSMVVGKAVSMVNMTKVKLVGLLENMSYVKCPCCDQKIEIYGRSKLNEACLEYHLVPLGNLPIDSKLTRLIDNGQVEDFDTDLLDLTIHLIEML